jgi:hypothetical protein
VASKAARTSPAKVVSSRAGKTSPVSKVVSNAEIKSKAPVNAGPFYLFFNRHAASDS